MNIKKLIKLFVPPVFVKLWHLLKRDSNSQNKPISEKSIAYNYIVEMNKRSRLSFQNIEALSKDYSFAEINSISSDIDEPNYYGSFWTLARYAGISLMNYPPKNFSIQHGIVYDLLKWEDNKRNMTNLVWSREIAKMYKRKFNGSNVLAIGAPFFYADSLLAKEKILLEKKRLGRNLLAIPMHSTHFINVTYNPNAFIQELKKQLNCFDTVRVCLYWADIQQGIADVYRKAGFECVCCGHLFDQFFLQRQKSLYEIADATISNSVGSHLGYSIAMKKPHLLVPDKYEVVDLNEIEEGKEEEAVRGKSINYKMLLNEFSENYDYKITEEQIRIVDKLWGLSDKKTPFEMKELLNNLYEVDEG